MQEGYTVYSALRPTSNGTRVVEGVLRASARVGGLRTDRMADRQTLFCQG